MQDEEKLLKPTSPWLLEQLKQFCDLDFKSGGGFTKQDLEAVPLLPEEQAFAACQRWFERRGGVRTEGEPPLNMQ